MATPWETDLGTYQGRIEVDGAPEGSYVFELGHALRAKRNLAIGDYHEVKQSLPIDQAAYLLRATIVIVPPEVMPAGYGFLLTGRLNGAVVASRPIPRNSKPIVLSDFAIPLWNAAGEPAVEDIAFRLEVSLG